MVAHRAAWELTNGPVRNGLFVLHRCDNRACVNPAHLFLGTHDDNMADMVSKGRQARGSVNGRAKLTEESVREILAVPTQGRVLAKRFGVTPQCISRVRRGHAWAHV
jgi:hypothetical protein